MVTKKTFAEGMAGVIPVEAARGLLNDMKEETVRSLLEGALRRSGGAGLFNREAGCACKCGALAPCGAVGMECEMGGALAFVGSLPELVEWFPVLDERGEYVEGEKTCNG